MWAFLPFLNLVLLTFVFRNRIGSEPKGWRESILSAAVIWGLLFVASTEILSLFRALAFHPLLLFWLFITVMTLGLLYRNRHHWHLAMIIQKPMPPLSLIEKTCLVGIIIIVLAVGLTAVIAPPNTNDVLAYHMSRIMHWIQNRSLENHPVHNGCQLNHPPGAEYLILQLEILSDSDRLANIPQFLGVLISLVAVSLIAWQLGADRKGQILSAFLAITIPIMILEGSSAKNHVLTAAWLTISIYFFLKLDCHFSSKNIFIFSSALGLSLLTKIISLFIFGPFLIPPLFRPHQRNIRQIGKFFIITTLALTAINAGYLIRSWDLRDLSQEMIVNGQIPMEGSPSIQSFFANVLRHLAIDLGTPWESFNQAIIRMIIAIHSWLKIFCPLPDKPFSYPSFPFHEDHPSNAVHVLLFFYSTFLFFFKSCLRKRKIVTDYSLSLFTAIVLFLGIIKWSAFVSRYHLLFLLPACPFMAVILTEKHSRVLPIIIFILFAAAMPYTFQNPSRPLLGKGSLLLAQRSDVYFYNMNPGFSSATRIISENILNTPCRDIGIILKPNQQGPEYIFGLLLGKNRQRFRIENVLVTNSSRKFSYPLGEFNPCAIIRDSGRPVSELNFKGKKFVPACQENSLQLFIPLSTGLDETSQNR